MFIVLIILVVLLVGLGLMVVTGLNRLRGQSVSVEEAVERAEKITLRYTDLESAAHEVEAEGLRAVCFQHEIDHLDGILFIDHISRLKRNLYVQKRKKALRREAEETDEPVTSAPGTKL